MQVSKACDTPYSRRLLTDLIAQTKVEQVNALVDWEPDEEARLLRKLDLRVLLPCCIVYFLAYLGEHINGREIHTVYGLADTY